MQGSHTDISIIDERNTSVDLYQEIKKCKHMIIACSFLKREQAYGFDQRHAIAKYNSKTEIQRKSPCIFIMKGINLNNRLLILLIQPFLLQL